MSGEDSAGRGAGKGRSIVASVLSKLLEAVGGAQEHSQRKDNATLLRNVDNPVPAVIALERRQSTQQEIVIRLEDAREIYEQGVAYDRSLFDGTRLSITPAIAKAFKADALAKLGEDHQPTEEQWSAILTPSSSVVTVGVAGTGKTFVMQMRVLLLNLYLEIPLDEMTVLAVTKDCRFDVIGQLQHLYSTWGVELSSEQCLDLVKTPRGALLSILRAVEPLRDAVPFELMRSIDDGDEDGRPFDPRLTTEQLSFVEAAYQQAYRSNPAFAKSIEILFASSVSLPPTYPDTAPFNRLCEAGSSQLPDDEKIIRAVTSLWTAQGAWPVAGFDSELKPLDVMGHRVLTNGYIPVLDAYVVLGFPKQGDRFEKRHGADYSLYEELLSKRAFMQRYSSARIIWLSTSDQIAGLVRNIEHLGSRAPSFNCSIKGQERPAPVAEALYQTGSLIETLGLNPAKTIGQLKFMPHDPDAKFFDCAARFWPLFETSLMNSNPKMFTSNRLFQMFGMQGDRHLRAVPIEALKRMRNVLTDELQDITVHTGEFIRACIAENRHRIEVEGISNAVMSIFACGDDFQTAHGTQGATPKYLTDFQRHFPSRDFKRNLLGVNFRSQPGIIQSAHSLITGIPAVSMLAPVSVAQEGESRPVEVYDLSALHFMALFDIHYADGDSILILAANPGDYKRSEEYVNVVVARDRTENPESRRVRVRAVQRSKGLEADVCFILGDLIASTSTWAKNQIFKTAKTVATEDQSPFDVIQQNELYRLAHIGITRARKRCYWLVSPESADVQQLRASTRISEEYGNFVDKR